MLNSESLPEHQIFWVFWYLTGIFAAWYTIAPLRSIKFANSHFWAILFLITLIFGVEIIFLDPKRKEIKEEVKENDFLLRNLLKYLLVTLVSGFTWIVLLLTGLAVIYYRLVPGI